MRPGREVGEPCRRRVPLHQLLAWRDRYGNLRRDPRDGESLKPGPLVHGPCPGTLVHAASGSDPDTLRGWRWLCCDWCQTVVEAPMPEPDTLPLFEGAT